MSTPARFELATVTLAVWLASGGCAQEAARLVYVFETTQVLDGSPPQASYLRYESSPAACETQRSTLILNLTKSTTSVPTTISSRCYPALLEPGGSGLATEAPAQPGMLTIFGSFTREPAPCVPTKELRCFPATLTPTAR